MDLDRIEQAVKRVSFNFDGVDGWVEYRPNFYTVDFDERLRYAMRQEGVKETAQMLSELYTSWSLTRGGVAVPTSPEGIISIPLRVLNFIDAVVQEDMGIPGDDEKRGLSTPTGSPPDTSTPDSGSFQNGSESSSPAVPLPASSASASPT